MSVKSLIPRILLLGVIDVIAIQLAVTLGSSVSFILGVAVALFTLIVNIAFLDDRFFPWRWISPAMAGMALLVIYPIGFSVVVAFSNWGDGNALEKQQALNQYSQVLYTPPNSPTYRVAAFAPLALENRVQREDLVFWLVRDDQSYVVKVGDEALKPAAEQERLIGNYGELDANGIPQTIEGYRRLNTIQLAGLFRKRDNLDRGTVIVNAPPDKIEITSQRATVVLPKYTYDAAQDTMTDNETGKVYRAVQGTFIFGEGETIEKLTPGWRELIGFDNLLRVVRDPAVSDPFFRVTIWTFTFAIGTVLITFAVGLGMALVINDKNLPLRTLWRSLLIVPYAIPFWLSATTWQGLFNGSYGPVGIFLNQVFGIQNVFADPLYAKLVILFVNLYLGFPYMMLITLGALQSIPSDMYEAATIDGADSRQQFQYITLPLLLVAVGPLLVASFAFNFNNFTLIELLTRGGPPISAGTVAGHTDILLSYTFRLAFGGGAGTDYGFASAIGIFIFMIVGTVTFFNFRLTKRLETFAD